MEIEMEKGKVFIPAQEEPGEKGIVKREIKGAIKIYVSSVSVGLGFFEIYTAYFGILDPLKQACIFATFLLSLGFIIYPFSKNRVGGKWFIFDIILTIIAVSIPLYVVIFHDKILLSYGNITLLEVYMGYVLVFLFLELGRRTMGPTLSIITFLFLFYGLAGRIMPGLSRHAGIDIKYLSSFLFASSGGIWGIPMAVTTKYLYLFILFGIVSVASGCGEVLINIANSIAGKAAGGPAKVSVISSGLFGSISGSAVANVVSTGSFTIPMMKKLGFKPSFAAAVEAVASTGGVLMPPVMGSVAFVMAEMMGVSYFAVVKAAIIPAILYYTSIFFQVHFRAKKIGLKGIDPSEVPNFFDTIKKEGYLFLPLIILIYFMIVRRASPALSCFWSLVATLILFMIRSEKEKRLNFRKLIDCFESAAKITVSLVAAVAMAGMIMAVILLTGVALRFSGIILSIAGGRIIIVLILTAIISLILGMGVTSTVSYLIPAILVVPILVQSGFLPMACNMFVLYFAIISYITPPVAIASYAAAGLADADMFETGWTAFKLGLAGFIVPFMFIFSPTLIMVGHPLGIIISFVSACIGVLMLASSIEGFFLTRLNLIERILFFIGALCLIDERYITSAIGLTILLLVYLEQRVAFHKKLKLNG
ncbi:MAG: TRAP transporter permease [Actinobacteria bacterium]|nr:TRAP transporter permease [Actinomycetota bacterium]